MGNDAHVEFNALVNLVSGAKVPTHRVLAGAVGVVESVVVVGRDAKGGLYVASSEPLDKALLLMMDGTIDLMQRKAES